MIYSILCLNQTQRLTPSLQLHQIQREFIRKVLLAVLQADKRLAFFVGFYPPPPTHPPPPSDEHWGHVMAPALSLRPAPALLSTEIQFSFRNSFRFRSQMMLFVLLGSHFLFHSWTLDFFFTFSWSSSFSLSLSLFLSSFLVFCSFFSLCFLSPALASDRSCHDVGDFFNQ